MRSRQPGTLYSPTKQVLNHVTFNINRSMLVTVRRRINAFVSIYTYNNNKCFFNLLLIVMKGLNCCNIPASAAVPVLRSAVLHCTVLHFNATSFLRLYSSTVVLYAGITTRLHAVLNLYMLSCPGASVQCLSARAC